jgi:Flp pilus assembly pilin Flp
MSGYLSPEHGRIVTIAALVLIVGIPTFLWWMKRRATRQVPKK